MPIGIGISPIFNVVGIYPFVANDTRQIIEGKDPNDDDLQWLRQMPEA